MHVYGEIFVYKKNAKCKIFRTASIELRSLLCVLNVHLFFFFFSAAPAICEYDIDCLRGKAKCVRRECHCTGRFDYGDGKENCDRKYKSFCSKALSGVLKNETDQNFSLLNS